jgi:hypothetical protein
MPRFVILTHDWPFPHWDLMLEAGDVLRTWRLLDEPGPDRRVRAEALADHRLAYLDYEGPLSGDRGSVTRWDAGEFEWEPDSSEPLRLLLHGRRIEGAVTISMPTGEIHFGEPADRAGSSSQFV